jgi:NAD(P)-dependent dehydrogenase (short-subunit alcohol dehydrogenase family)
MEFEGKVALVTGAGSGIGRAAAVRLAQGGAIVGLLGHTPSELEDAAAEIRKAGGTAMVLNADVRDVAAMRKSIAALVDTHKRLDIAIANAGINGVQAPIDDLQPEEWDTTIDTNLKGSYLTLHFAIPHLKKAGGGAIVLVSSVNGTRLFSTAGDVAYSCTKAAQVAMMKIAALELARFRIRVNAVCPGSIATEIGDNSFPRNNEAVESLAEYPKGEVPLTNGKPGSAEDVAELIAFLVSDRAKHISGSPVWIDGTQSLLVG